jgi:hypothetical protein
MTPATASPDPNGKDRGCNTGRSVSYPQKNIPIYGTICAIPAETPRKKPVGPSLTYMSVIEARNEAYTFSDPCAAKRVLSRSKGYVAVVDTAPAVAPEMNASALAGSQEVFGDVGDGNAV